MAAYEVPFRLILPAFITSRFATNNVRQHPCFCIPVHFIASLRLSLPNALILMLVPNIIIKVLKMGVQLE